MGGCSLHPRHYLCLWHSADIDLCICNRQQDTPYANKKTISLLIDISMNHQNFAFTKTNFILLAIGMVIVVLGFILMAGGSSTEQMFNAEIFNVTRIKVAPMVCLCGFFFMIVAVVYRKKELSTEEGETDRDSK